MKTAIIIPTYNEKENIQKLILDIFDLDLKDLEIVVVDDNSPDGTAEVVRKMASEKGRIHLIKRSGKLGYGTACVEGFGLALSQGAQNIVGMDSDFSHDPKIIPLFLEKMEKYDLVVGSRYLNGISIVNWPLRRLMLSILAGKYVRLVTGMKLSDPTSGFSCYRRETLEKIGLEKIKSNGYSFLIELKHRIYKKRFSIGEIPIIFIDRQNGTSKMSKAIMLEALIIVWKLRLGIIR